MYKYMLNERYKEFDKFLVGIEDYFLSNNDTIHKARNELKIIKYKNLDTVVKSFKVPHLLNKIIYTFFKKSKAKKSYEYALILKDFTPDVIGYIEFYKNNLLDKSYLISKKFDYDFTIREPLLDKNFANRDEIFKEFARFSFKLHEEGIYHHDYSPGNILIKKDKNSFIFKIVDINRMSFYNLDEKARAKSFSKLWASDDVLRVIALEYIKHYKTKDNFVDDVILYSQKHKNFKNFKKRLKGKKVVD